MHLRQLRVTLLFLTLVLSCSVTSLVGQVCPKIELKGDDGAIVYGQESELSAIVPPEFLVEGVTYDWTVTEGLEFLGQKSNTISFSAPRKFSGRTFDIEVKVTGLRFGCEGVSKTNVRVVGAIDYFPVDEFTVYSDEELRARVANLFLHVNKSPDLVALIEIQFKLELTYKERVRRVESILKTLKVQNRGIDRVFFLISSEHESTFTRFWLWPEDRISNFASGRGTVVSGNNIKAQLPTLLKTN